MMEQVDPLGQPMVLIHFVFQENPERIACMPHMMEFHSTPHHPNYQRTNDTRAANCPACKRTSVYKDRHRENQHGRPAG